MQCEATTNAGTRCSRKALLNSRYCWQHQNYKASATHAEGKAPSNNIIISTNKRNNILQTLSNNDFTQVGQYLNYYDLANTKISKFPASTYLLKKCITMDYNLKHLRQMVPTVTKLKDLTLIFNNRINLGEIDIVFDLLKSVKNLEALHIEYFPELLMEELYPGDNYIIFSTDDIKWSGFKLKYLNLDGFIKYNIYNIVKRIPTLETLIIGESDSINIEDFINNNSDRIPDTLKSLDISYTTQYLNLQKFRYLKELNLGLISFDSISETEISDFKNLEILTIETDDYEFLTKENLSYFPTNLKVLGIDYIGYQNTLFLELKFSELEYLILKNLGSLQHIIDTIIHYPKLQHILIKELKFRTLNPKFLDKLKVLVKHKPNLTFDFYKIKYQVLSESFKESINFADENYKEQYTEEMKDKMSKEIDAENLYWPQLQQIFKLTDLVIDESNFKHLEKFQYLPSDWRRDHGYYTRIECDE